MVEERGKYHVVTECFTRDIERGVAMMLIIGLDGTDGASRLIARTEGEKPLSRTHSVAKPSVLRHDRSTRSQVARTALTEPPGSQTHVLILRDGQLAAGRHDIGPVRLGVTRQRLRWAHMPTIALEEVSVCISVLAESELDRGINLTRKIQDLHEIRDVCSSDRSRLDM